MRVNSCRTARAQHPPVTPPPPLTLPLALALANTLSRLPRAMLKAEARLLSLQV